jgi:hypothetical protein
LYSLDQLVQFCIRNKIQNFDAKEAGKPLTVYAPASFDAVEDTDTSLFFGDILAFHTGRNRNKSSISEDVAIEAMKDMAYKPVLANFTTIDGVEDFTSHDMELDEDGNIVYIEHQIGAFTADEPSLVDDPEGSDRKFVKARVGISKEYSHAYDIIKRKGGKTKVSVELKINKMSYDSKSDTLIFEDIEVLGVTLLGTNPETGEEVQEGMQGANLTISDFSVNKNVQVENDLIAKLEQLLNKYSERKEVNGMDDENIVINEKNENTVEGNNNIEPQNNFSISLSINDKKYEYSTSMSDTLNALNVLVNDTYGEDDNDIYFVDAYPDTNTVVFVSWFSNNIAYKQTYKEEDGVFSLVGDRVAVHRIYVTDEEQQKLDEMRSNYSSVVEKLQKYEDEPKKIEILNNDAYSSVSGLDEFKQLKKQENHFDMTIDDVTKKADEILLNAAKTHIFAMEKSNDNVLRKTFQIEPKENVTRGRYGNLFANKD